jgi:hypothetical protein
MPRPHALLGRMGSAGSTGMDSRADLFQFDEGDDETDQVVNQMLYGTLERSRRSDSDDFSSDTRARVRHKRKARSAAKRQPKRERIDRGDGERQAAREDVQQRAAELGRRFPADESFEPRRVASFSQQLDVPQEGVPDGELQLTEPAMVIPIKPAHACFEEGMHETEPGGDRDWCFLCVYGQNSADAECNVEFQGLVRFFREQFHRMGPEQFTRDAQVFYNTKLRQDVELDTDDPEYKPMIWHRSTIYKHATQHVLTPLAIVEEFIRTLHAAAYTIRDGGMFVLNKECDLKQVDFRTLSNYIKLNKQTLVNLSMWSKLRGSSDAQ